MRKKRNNKNNNQKQQAPLVSGNLRRKLVLEIIRSDSTFELYTFSDGEQSWVGKCIHCNARMTVRLNGETGFTVEHIVPRSASGQNDLKNLALACGGCNQEKGHRHDQHTGKGGRADEVINFLQQKRLDRWRANYCQ